MLGEGWRSYVLVREEVRGENRPLSEGEEGGRASGSTSVAMDLSRLSSEQHKMDTQLS